MSPDPVTPDFSRALPDRPIKVRPPFTIGPMSTLGVFVLLVWLLAGALWWLGPDLARDWRIGGEVARAGDARIENANCRSRFAVLTLCDITFVDLRSANPTPRKLWYLFIDRLDGEPIVLVRPKMPPASGAEAISTNLGLDKFYHRLLALSLIVAGLALCIAMSIQLLWEGVVTRRELTALNGHRLRAVVVAIEGSFIVAHKRRRWTYVYDRNGSQEQAFIELPTNNEPLFVARGGKRALALCGPGGGVPLLLDAKLACLDLTPAEKDAFFAACRRALDEQNEPAA